MSEHLDKQSRKEKLHEVRARQRAVARAKLPLPADQMQAMLDMLDTELPKQNCDHTLRLVRQWAEQQRIPFEGLAISFCTAPERIGKLGFTMTTVTLDDKAARVLEMLSRQAASRGVPLDRYLADLAVNGERTISSAAARSPHELTPAEFRQWLTDVSAGMPSLPPIPADFSRADIYNDHD